MQFLVLILVFGLFLAPATPAAAGPWWLWPALLGAKAALGAVYWVMCQLVYHRLSRRSAPRWLRTMEITSTVFRLAVLKLYVLDVLNGGLGQIRQAFSGLVPGGDVIALDELLLMLPTLALVGFAWWAYYPIDYRLREAALLRQLDCGRPVHRIWTRKEYLLSQYRHQVLFLLIPLALLLGWEELLRSGQVTALLERAGAGDWGHALLLALGFGVVFLLAPLMIRRVWDTAPLPAGETRERLVAMCRQQGVGIRELLLWRTFGGMINGAVMGIVARFRYILLTDALLEHMPAPQVEAVMAHEVAHIRKNHMFWLLGLGFLAAPVLWIIWAVVVTTGVEKGLSLILQHLFSYQYSEEVYLSVLLGRLLLLLGRALYWLATVRILDSGLLTQVLPFVGTIVSWIALFGWISRRFERQADSFAAQYLARKRLAVETVEAAAPVAGLGGFAAVPGGLAAPVLTFAGSGRPALAPPEPAAAPEPPVVDWDSASAMADALQAVADLNNIPVKRHSWRHGAIAWRQAYLRSLVGKCCDRLPIDRQVFWIKAGGLLTLSALAVAVCFHPALWDEVIKVLETM